MKYGLGQMEYIWYQMRYKLFEIQITDYGWYQMKYRLDQMKYGLEKNI